MNLVHQRQPLYYGEMMQHPESYSNCSSPHGSVGGMSQQATGGGGSPAYRTRDSWFPSHPNCPNHTSTAGSSFNAAYADPNSQGQVSCPDCFIRFTIKQSMSALPACCPHLHASHDCAHCYAQQWPGAGMSHRASPLTPQQAYAAQHLVQPVISPPLLASPERERRYNDGGGSPCQQPPVSSRQPVYGASSLQHDVPGAYPLYGADLAPRRELEFARNAPRFSPASNPGRYSPPLLNHPPPSANDKEAANRRRQVATASCEHEMNGAVAYEKASSGLLNVKKDPSIRKRSAHDICQVCGDRASGYHYNALTCEGCKGFFRRSINKKEVPARCKYGGNCEMDTYQRRKCPECRLKKCRAVGMLEECLLTEIQCQSKRRSRVRKTRDDVSPRPGPGSKGSTGDVTTEVPSDLESSRSSIPSIPPVDEEPQTLASNYQDVITEVGSAFAAYRTNREIMERWGKYLQNASSLNLCEISTIHVQVLVQFTKKLPGFVELKSEDQIALLKGSFVEAMILRNCCGYHYRKSILNVENIAKDAGLPPSQMKVLVNFFMFTRKLDMDDVEYGLLIAVVMFDPDHQHAQDKAKIELLRDDYLSILSRYCQSRKPRRPQILAKILALMTEMRTLYHTYTRLVNAWKKREALSPLLCEIWDLRKEEE